MKRYLTWKWTSLIAVMVGIMCFLCIPYAMADEDGETSEGYEEFAVGSASAFDGEVSSVDVETIGEILAERYRDAIYNCVDTVYIYDLNINRDIVGHVHRIMMHYFPECFWLSTDFEYIYSISSGKVIELELEYYAEPWEVSGLRNKYEKKVNEIIDGIPSQYRTDHDKALYLYDWIILNSMLDFGNDELIKTSYGPIVASKGLNSVAYSRAFADLISRVGIEFSYVNSEMADVTWIRAYLDGDWFDVDLYLGDLCTDHREYRVFDHYNTVNHMYAFVDTYSIRSFYGISDDYSLFGVDDATNRKYLSYFYRFVTSPIFKYDDRWYYMYDGNFVSSQLSGADTEIIYSATKPAYGYFANNRFYFSEGNALRSINLDGSDLVTYTVFPSNTSIEEFYVTSDRFVVGLIDAYGNYITVEHRLDDIQLSPSVPKDGWLYENGKWYYYYSGSPLIGLHHLDGHVYYFSADGVMTTGWQLVNGTWYYFDANGSAATGWRAVGGTWYYFRSNGEMVSGWVKDGSVWYYMNPSGAMTTGWKLIGGTWYYFAGSGAMKTGWLQFGTVWYYLDNSGAMVHSGWYSIGGIRYYFDHNGVWCE